MSMEFERDVLPLFVSVRHTDPTQLENSKQAQSDSMYGIKRGSEFPCCCCISSFSSFHDFCEHLNECEEHRNAR